MNATERKFKITDLMKLCASETARADRAEQELAKRDKCSFMGPMRDCPTHGESEKLQAMQQEFTEHLQKGAADMIAWGNVVEAGTARINELEAGLQRKDAALRHAVSCMDRSCKQCNDWMAALEKKA